jgi:hypothetical protein
MFLKNCLLRTQPYNYGWDKIIHATCISGLEHNYIQPDHPGDLQILTDSFNRNEFQDFPFIWPNTHFTSNNNSLIMYRFRILSQQTCTYK